MDTAKNMFNQIIYGYLSKDSALLDNASEDKTCTTVNAQILKSHLADNAMNFKHMDLEPFGEDVVCLAGFCGVCKDNCENCETMKGKHASYDGKNKRNLTLTCDPRDFFFKKSVQEESDNFPPQRRTPNGRKKMLDGQNLKRALNQVREDRNNDRTTEEDRSRVPIGGRGRGRGRGTAPGGKPKDVRHSNDQSSVPGQQNLVRGNSQRVPTTESQYCRHGDLCRKGDNCPYLHSRDILCKFEGTGKGICTNNDCPFKHKNKH